MKNITIQFYLTKVSGSLAGADPKWQAHTIPNGVMTFAELCETVAKDTNRSVEDIEYIYKCAWRKAIAYARQGYTVYIGDNIVVKSVMRGAFDSKDAPFDPDRNAVVVIIITTGDARNCIPDNVKYVNTDRKPDPVIHTVADKDHAEEGVLYVGGTVYVQGKNLAIDATQPGEGVFLLDPSTKEVVATGTVVKSDQQLVNATFAEWPDAGDYLLRLSTRSGWGVDYSLSSVTKSVTVKAAE